MQRLHKFADIFFIVLLVVIISTAFFIISPYRIPVPHRDSGIFLQIGSEILHGKVLYRQAWGNSLPLIFFINALGLWLGKGSVWGVWGLELFFFLAMVFLGYWILRSKLSAFGSFFVFVTSFFTIFQFMSGNFTEEYALLFQIGILALCFFFYLPNQSRNSRSLASFGIGVLMGINFTIKQTFVDVALSVILLIIFLAWVQKNRQIFNHLLLIGLGFIFVNISFLIYFFKNGALNDYISSTFLFNKYYLSLGLLELFHSILEILEFLSLNPFLVIMCTVWLASIIVLLISGRKLYQEVFTNRKSKWVFLLIGLLFWLLFFWEESLGGSPGIGLLGWATIITGSIFGVGAFLLFIRKPVHNSEKGLVPTNIINLLTRIDWNHPGTAPFLFLGLVDLPIVIFFISLSGRNYSHYYISLFPALFLLLAGGLVFLNQIVANTSHKKILNSVLAAILISGSFAPILHITVNLGKPGNGNSFSETATYLNSVTTAQDKILIWGWESVIYFIADREPSTRYGFQFPAYFKSPYQQIVLSNLLEDIKREPPKYIADTVNSEMPLIEGRSANDCLAGSKLDDAQLLSIISFVCSNYKFEIKIEEINIYKLTNRN